MIEVKKKEIEKFSYCIPNSIHIKIMILRVSQNMILRSSESEKKLFFFEEFPCMCGYAKNIYLNKES